MNKTLVGFDNTDGTLQAVYLIDYEYISCATYDWAFDVTEEQASILVNSGDVKDIIGQVTGDDVGWFSTLDEAENMRKQDKKVAKIINFGYTSSLDNKGIILTGEEAELFETEEAAVDGARFIVDEAPDGDDVYVWQDSYDKWHVGW